MVADGALKVFAVPVAVKLTAWPDTGLPCASFTVASSVVVLVLFACTEPGVAVSVDALLAAGPATKLAVPVTLVALNAAVMVLDCASVEGHRRGVSARGARGAGGRGKCVVAAVARQRHRHPRHRVALRGPAA